MTEVRAVAMTDKATVLARLARLVAATSGSRDLAVRLGEACRDLLGVDGASITVETGTPNRVTLCVTDEISTRLEELQDVLGQGPCWDAYRTGQPTTTDLGPEADRRWPQFAEAARRAVGRRGIMAVPMRPGSHVLGVLGLHQAGFGEPPSGLDTAQFLADTVGAALLRDPRAPGAPDESGPWSGRATIHQATGMVISQLRLPASDALAILRAHAYAHDTTLHDIAHQVINRTLNFGKDPE